MIRTIIALDRDGLDVSLLVMNFEVPNKGFDLSAAVCAASTEYCQTEEGKRVYEGNCNCFNWADFDSYVPNEICKKHGFSKIPSEAVADEVVNWDEELVDEDEIFRDDDEEEDEGCGEAHSD